MNLHSLHPLFEPTNIALIGASERAGALGTLLLQNALSSEFRGKFFPVNPKYKSVQSQPCYRALKDIEQPIDLAIICTPIHRLGEQIKACGKAKIPVALIMSEGEYDKNLMDIARQSNVRLIGPNSAGIIRPWRKLNATLMRHLPSNGKLALISQSSAMTHTLLDWAEDAKVGFSTVVTTSSECDVDVADMLDYLINDGRTKSILLYLNQISNGRRFMSALSAAAKEKPIVVLKSSYTAERYCDIVARTGEVMSSDDVFTAAVHRAGAVRVNNIHDVFSAAKALSDNCRTQGKKLGILSNGIAPAFVAVDQLRNQKLDIPHLSEELQSQLKSLGVSDSANPVILNHVEGLADQCHAIGKALLSSGEIDALLVIHAPDPRTDALEVAKQLSQIKQQRRPLLTCWMGEIDSVAARQHFRELDIPTFRTPEAAVRAFTCLCAHLDSQKQLLQVPYPLSKSAPPNLGAARRLLSEALEKRQRVLDPQAAKSLLSLFHIPVVQSQHANNVQEAVECAEQIGYPVVVKLQTESFTYKSDFDGVRLNIGNEQALKDACIAMHTQALTLISWEHIRGFTVEKMVPAGQSRAIRIRVLNDPTFGPVISFGSGGDMGSIYLDRCIQLPPLNRYLCDDLMARSPIAKLLENFRNFHAVDKEVLRRVLMRISSMVCELPEIHEMTVNPLLVKADRAIALDVQVVLQSTEGEAIKYSHLAIHPYPQDWVSVNRLKNGDAITLRPIRPEDAKIEHDFVNRLSSESKYFRFMHAVRELSPHMLAKFTKIDYDREMAFVALSQSTHDGAETMVGVSRYAINPDKETCEFAVAIADDWTGRGLAKLLMNRIIKHAQARGLSAIEGTVLINNTAMHNLMTALGFKGSRNEEDRDIMDYVLDLKSIALVE